MTVANSDIPDEGKKLWVEGETVSGADKDSGYTLDVKDVDEKTDTVAITVKEIKITPKKTDYTVVLSKTGAVTVTHPIMTFDIEGPPNWYIDVQLSRTGGGALDAGPGLSSGWKSSDARDARPGKDLFSSFTTGDRTQLDGSGKVTYEVPLDWWKDQARRPRADFQTVDLAYRAVVVSDTLGSAIGFSTKNGGTPATVPMRNNLVNVVFQNNGYAQSGGRAVHNIAWYFDVREANTTEMYTVVQWKLGYVKYWPGGVYGYVKDYGKVHQTNMPEWSIDRLETEPRYHNGVYDISNGGKRAGSSDAPSVTLSSGRTMGYRHYDFETRVHLNFEVPGSVTITRQEGAAEPYDVLIGKLADPQPFQLDMKPWSTRILWDGTTVTNPDTYP